MTLLSIIGAKSIAIPMSPAFPPHELQYIMDHSQACMLLASEKFGEKAQSVIDEGLEGNPLLVKVQKILSEEKERESVRLDGTEGKGGMMLYTSGTTNRPVSSVWMF